MTLGKIVVSFLLLSTPIRIQNPPPNHPSRLERFYSVFVVAISREFFSSQFLQVSFRPNLYRNLFGPIFIEFFSYKSPENSFCSILQRARFSQCPESSFATISRVFFFQFPHCPFIPIFGEPFCHNLLTSQIMLSYAFIPQYGRERSLCLSSQLFYESRRSKLGRNLKSARLIRLRGNSYNIQTCSTEMFSIKHLKQNT